MAAIIDRALKTFYSRAESLSRTSGEVSIEDARFIKFTELLDLSEIIENPTICRYSGGRVNAPWSIMGYSLNIERDIDNEADSSIEDDDDSDTSFNMNHNTFSETHNYTIINGLFHGLRETENSKKADILKIVKETHRFIDNTIKKEYDFLVSDSHDIVDLQHMLIESSRKNIINRIQIIIISDYLMIQDDLPKNIPLHTGVADCRVEYFDIRRWSDIYYSKSKREPVNFSLTEMGYNNIEVVSNDNNNDLKCFLTAFPGNLIADLYDNFHMRLLESNVRMFLSLKRKKNRGMVHTIEHEPELFLSYNNGISATASNIKYVPNSNIIDQIEDFQIVNGGQTTATLYHSKVKLKKDLSNVFVQVKLTMIRDPEERKKAVPQISKFSNTQTEIRKSDFHANNPYLINLAKLSKKCYYIDKNGINNYYFFERMAGQYNEERSKQGPARHQAAWEQRYPADGVFAKIDIGRWMNILYGKPHLAATSAEKSFESFINRTNEGKSSISVNEYKNLVAFGMIFRRARTVCGKKNSKTFPPIISDSSVGMATTIHSMGFLHYITSGRLDYHKIFNKEYPENFLDELLVYVIKECWKIIEKSGGSSAQEYAKNEKCWKSIKKNVRLNNNNLMLIEPMMLSEKVLQQREKGDVSENQLYFNLLDKYYKNKGSLFMSLFDLSILDGQFSRYRAVLRNLKKQIEERDSKIKLSRLKKINEFWEDVSNQNIELGETVSAKLDIDVDLKNLYNFLFGDISKNLEMIQNNILEGNEDEFDGKTEAFEKLKDIIEDYDSWGCLSLNQLCEIQYLLNVIN